VMLKLLLLEVFSNAAKYRQPESRIVVRVAVWPREESEEAREESEEARHVRPAYHSKVEGTLELVIESQDKLTAPSLTLEECARVFEHGFRAKNAQSTGTGVGLSTASKAAAALGGTLSMAVGQGPEGQNLTAVTFRVTTMKPETRAAAESSPPTSVPSEESAPCCAPTSEFVPATAAGAAIEEEATLGHATLPMALPPPADKPSLAKLRFLIADDSRMQLKLLAIILKQMCPQCKIVSVYNGEDALAKLAPKRSSFNPGRFDVLITDNDFGNGLLTGAEMVAQLTQLQAGSQVQPSCRLITVGCSASDGSLETLHHAGANLVWRKPIPDPGETATQLAWALARVRESRDVSCEVASAPACEAESSEK